MIHLDTHVLVWLAEAQTNKIPRLAQALMTSEPVAISPMVEVELAVLREIGRINRQPHDIIDAATPACSFIRDPFDRMIAAHAGGLGVQLVTADTRLRANLDFCVWD